MGVSWGQSPLFRLDKGVHPAGLNFGDCFAYDVDREHDCPLLFVGDDFTRADIRPALNRKADCAFASEVMRAGSRSLQTQDAAIARWLHCRPFSQSLR